MADRRQATLAIQQSRGIGRVAAYLLAANIVLDLVSLFGDLRERGLLSQIKMGAIGPGFEVSVQASDHFQFTLAMMSIALLIVTGGVYLMWLYRAVRSLSTLGIHNFAYSPGWAVGWFFVPVMNLVRPYQVHTDLMKASHPGFSNWKDAPGTPVVAAWWLLWIASGITARVGASLVRREPYTINDLLTSNGMFMVSAALSIGAAIALILFIRQVSDMQAGKASEMPPPAG